MSYARLLKIKEQLEEYWELEDDEHGEAVSLMCELVSRYDYVSDDFKIALEKELAHQLNNYKEYTEIVERQVTHSKTLKELVYL
jgi:hypothetical protein